MRGATVPFLLRWSIPVVACAAALAAAPAAAGTPVPAGLACLRDAYPERVCGAAPGALLWCDGTAMAWDDGEVKDLAAALARPDLEDQMSIPYPPRGSLGAAQPPGADPGRMRHLPFFHEMYGATEAEVRSRLVAVRFGATSARGRVWVTAVNGVADRLRAAAAEISRLPLPVRRIAAETAGGFAWRAVRGEERLSAHAFGIAVDVARGHGDFWRWAPLGADGLPRFRNRVPLEVVDALERQGFIWGGAWSHFDTMHFEYRPELLDPRCRAR